MGQLGALGLAGGARRVEDHRGVVAVAIGDLALRLGVAEQLLELARLDRDDLGAGLLGALLGGLGEVVPGEHQLGPRILEVELDLAPLEQHVHRHDGAARAQDAVVGDREVGDVREHDPDAVAGLEALLLQEAGHPRAALVYGLPVDLRVVQLVGDAVRDPLSGLRRDRGQVGHRERSPPRWALCHRTQAMASLLRKPFSALTSLAQPPRPGSAGLRAVEALHRPQQHRLPPQRRPAARHVRRQPGAAAAPRRAQVGRGARVAAALPRGRRGSRDRRLDGRLAEGPRVGPQPARRARHRGRAARRAPRGPRAGRRCGGARAAVAAAGRAATPRSRPTRAAPSARSPS